MFMEGIMSVFGDPLLILMMAIGTSVGIVFGAIPGLTATMAVTICLPLTYSMEPTRAISLLMSLYIGGISGGLISAILINVPGTPASMCTAFDGAPMAKKGMADKALGTGIFYSFLGTVFGLIVMIAVAPLLASLAIKFGPFEYCALSVFSLSLVIALTGKDMVRGLCSALFGIMLATVGVADFDNVIRFTFGNVQLLDGFTQLVLMIGFFAVPEVLGIAEKVGRPKETIISQAVKKIKGLGFTMKEFIAQVPNFLISACIGAGIGILPGIGGGTAGIMSYTVVKNRSKYPEKFGTGVMDGIVASETANNAAVGGAMIPLLTLGIPGDGITAILLGSLIIHGVAPGPLIFQKNGALMYAIYAAIFLAAVFMLVFELGGLRGFIKVLGVPKNYLMPIILAMCCIGAFGASNRVFDVKCVFFFGILAYGMIKLEFPLMPLVIGFILGPIFEQNTRRAEQYMTYDIFAIFKHPIALVIIAITVFTIIVSLRANKRASRNEAVAATAADAADTAEPEKTNP